MKRTENNDSTLKIIVIIMGIVIILSLFAVVYLLSPILHQIYCEERSSGITLDKRNDQSNYWLKPTDEELKQIPSMSPDSRITPYYRELLKCERQLHFWLPFLKY